MGLKGCFPLSRIFFRANARKIYARKWKRGHVWKASRKRESWGRFNCYVYASPSIHCLYCIYARKIYVRTHVQNNATVEIHHKTIKRKIKITLTGKVEKQGTQAVATLHNIPINNKLNLHYLHIVFHQVLQKTNDLTSVQNILYYLYTWSPCAEKGVLGEKELIPLCTKTMKDFSH